MSSRRSWHVEAARIHRPFQRLRIPPLTSSPSPSRVKSTGLARCMRFGARENDRGQARRWDRRAKGDVGDDSPDDNGCGPPVLGAPRESHGETRVSASLRLSICMAFRRCSAPRLELTRVDGSDTIKAAYRTQKSVRINVSKN